MYNANAKYTVKVNHTVTTNNYPTSRKLFRKAKANHKKLGVILLYTITAIFYLWIILSFVDVLSNNLTTFEYADWNFFSLLCKLNELFRA